LIQKAFFAPRRKIVLSSLCASAADKRSHWQLKRRNDRPLDWLAVCLMKEVAMSKDFVQLAGDVASGVGLLRQVSPEAMKAFIAGLECERKNKSNQRLRQLGDLFAVVDPFNQRLKPKGEKGAVLSARANLQDVLVGLNYKF
jgi:hypothetical protein